MDTDNIYYEKLAEIIFPDVTMTPQDMEEKYPPRNLPADAKVTGLRRARRALFISGDCFLQEFPRDLHIKAAACFCFELKIQMPSVRLRAQRKI